MHKLSAAVKLILHKSNRFAKQVAMALSKQILRKQTKFALIHSDFEVAEAAQKRQITRN